MLSPTSFWCLNYQFWRQSQHSTRHCGVEWKTFGLNFHFSRNSLGMNRPTINAKILTTGLVYAYCNPSVRFCSLVSSLRSADSSTSDIPRKITDNAQKKSSCTRIRLVVINSLLKFVPAIFIYFTKRKLLQTKFLFYWKFLAFSRYWSFSFFLFLFSPLYALVECIAEDDWR